MKGDGIRPCLINMLNKMWWAQVAVLVMVIKAASGADPTFQCRDNFYSPPDCGFTYEFQDMDGEEISESVKDGELLYTLEAYDADDDTVTFEIEAYTGTLNDFEESGHNVLDVDSSSGAVTVKGEIDYETIHLLRIRWKLTDANGDDSTRSVVAYVINQNDNNPEFSTNRYQSDSIPENSVSPDDIITVVSASDADSDPDNDADSQEEIRYEIIGSHLNWPCNGGIFEIDDISGEISLKENQTLDFEASSQYTICVRASDSGKPGREGDVPLYDYAQVKVDILDVQDMVPVFTEYYYDVDIREDAPVGTVVQTVRAREGDRGVLAPNDILYSLTGGDGKFEINNATGEISIKEMLDREQTDSYTVTVKAQEIRENGLVEVDPSSDNVTITFQVSDADDENATFSSHEVAIELPENALQGSSVLLNGLSVEDIDQAPNNNFHLSLGGPDADAFTIANPDIRGQGFVDLRVANDTKLDYEKYQSLRFEIYADNGAGIVYDTAYINVTLLDQNDETPTFSTDQYTFEVEENSPGVSVGFTIATDADSTEYSTVTYRLFGVGDPPQFEINSTSGEIRTTKTKGLLDRERQGVYFFTCVASDGQRSGTAVVEIQLLDVNDNLPIFSPAQYTLLIEENKAPQNSLLTVSANDGDIDEQNKRLSYSLWNDSLSQRFDIDNETGVISLLEELDYEVHGPELDLIVIATDDGKVPRSGNATVTVVIRDMNDHEPVFSEEVYTGSISEGAARGMVVLQVSASDDDSPGSANSRIDYFFRDPGVSDFRIGISSGNVTVNSANLDRDDQSSYSLQVEASDRGDPSLSGYCLVNITILDVNNKPPTFDEPEPVAAVFENATKDSEVATVSASDLDETADLFYSIDEENIKGFKENGDEVDADFTAQFWIDNSTGVVGIERSLDRETVASYEIPITVEDLNAEKNYPQTAEAILVLTVLDINDQAPVFSEDSYEFEVAEDEPVGFTIATISATDTDEGANGDVKFELTGNEDFLLKIDPDSGRLSVNRTFDRETYSTYTAMVVARDEGVPQKSSNMTVRIIVLDVNDNGPYFNTTPTAIELLEDFPNETNILQVVAKDDDASDKFGSVTYEITAGNPDGIFTINDTTGWIMIAKGKELDRETEEEHTLTISAFDSEGLSATKEVTITVLDVNDNRPYFSSGSSAETNIQEVVPIGDIVYRVSADDNDEPGTNNTLLEYSITGGNEEGLFNITTDGGEGVVVTAVSLSNRVDIYELEIVASDNGNPSLTSEAFTLTVEVTDVNDDTPDILFPPNLAVFYVAENYTGFVLNVLARDTDEGENGRLTIAFIKTADRSDWKYFSIKQVDGQQNATISIDEPTDRETKEIYILEVRVQDSGPSTLFNTVSFTVVVNDTDDNEPLFWTDPSNRQEAAFNVEENAVTATVGFVNLATDADLPPNQHLYYFIVEGNDEEQFVLDKTSGQLSLQKALDRERNDTWDLVVKVTSDMDYSPTAAIPYDENDPTLLPVTVTVLDVNDNGPIFYIEDKLYTGGAQYNAEFDSEVIAVQAVDRDEGPNAVVVYEITSEKYTDTEGNDQAIPSTFRVDSSTGVVYTLRNFEKGDTGYFTLEITARDSLNAEFTDTATVSIYLYSEDQQVEMEFAKDTDTVRGFQEDFKKTIEEIILKYGNFGPSTKRATSNTEPVVVIDDIQVLTIDNQPVPGRSVMKFHAVNKQDNTIIAPSIIVTAVDSAYDYTETILVDYGVTTTNIAIPPTVPPPDLTWVQWLLVGILCVLVVIVVGLVATNCLLTSSYKRKLRAATAGVYEKINPTSKNANPMPNTNKFTEPGSNPVFQQKINEGFENDYTETPETAEAAEEEDDKKEKMANGHARQVPTEPPSEEQEVVLEMYDDSADYEHIGDNETGDQLLMQVLQEYDKERGKEQINLPEFANLTITEI